MWQNELEDSPPYQNISDAWDSDGYTYTPSFEESTDAKKCHDRRSHHCYRNYSKSISNNRYHYKQEFPRSSPQFKHWIDDEEDSQMKVLRSEHRNKKERSGNKKTNPKQNPGYVINTPSCYGYFSYDEVVQQLQGNKKIYKHSTEKKLN